MVRRGSGSRREVQRVGDEGCSDEKKIGAERRRTEVYRGDSNLVHVMTSSDGE